MEPITGSFSTAEKKIELTGGNLTVEERQLLEQGLYELRMRFMDVKNGAPRIIVP